MISSWGYRVESAEDGERALQMIESCDPQILLLDLRLPEKDGLAVLAESGERLAVPPHDRDPGEGEIEDAVESIKLGAYDYLRKPVDPHHLQVLLEHLRNDIEPTRGIPAFASSPDGSRRARTDGSGNRSRCAA